MKKALLFLAAAAVACAEHNVARVFIEPQEGYESYLAAAIVKKKTPLIVTQDREAATYVLTATVVGKEESTGGKIARCLFMYCGGIQGEQTVSIQLLDAKTKEVAYAYNVRKLGASNFQSTAEAAAKHMKQFLEENRR